MGGLGGVWTCVSLSMSILAVLLTSIEPERQELSEIYVLTGFVPQ